MARLGWRLNSTTAHQRTIPGCSDLDDGYFRRQAKYLCVPYVICLSMAPDNMTDQQVLFLTGIFSYLLIDNLLGAIEGRRDAAILLFSRFLNFFIKATLHEIILIGRKPDNQTKVFVHG